MATADGTWGTAVVPGGFAQRQFLPTADIRASGQSASSQMGETFFAGCVAASTALVVWCLNARRRRCLINTREMCGRLHWLAGGGASIEKPASIIVLTVLANSVESTPGVGCKIVVLAIAMTLTSDIAI